MNTKQFAFIICTNNEQYYDECVRYIQDLYVPEGYDIDIISIKEAESMAQGYNAGMQASDALYKVYLHQDTFILNRNLLYDILRIFKQDENIGMIGVLGARELPKDADCYLKWDTGMVTVYDGKMVSDWELYQNRKYEYVQVEAVDGLIMITRMDILWREDLLDGWSYYDVSQSLEMDRHGYKVVVPYQENPWCYHDCGVSRNEEHHSYHHKMIEEYREYFMENSDTEKNKAMQQDLTLKQEVVQTDGVRLGMINLIAAGNYDELVKIADSAREAMLEDTDIREIVKLMEIYSLEKGSVGKRFSEWWTLNDWEKIYEYYRWVRFALLRIGYQRDDERVDEMKMLVKEGRISKDAIRNISIAALGNAENVYTCLLKEANPQPQPLVSVIIAVYNGESFVGETIKSVLDQTYQNMEIIIIDDASTDGSRDVICSFKDSRIRMIFCEKNRNVCYTGNIGFQEAKGKYVALMGHDDLWAPDKLEKQVDFMEEHPAYSVCFTWVDIIDENRKIINNKYKQAAREFCSDNRNTDRWLQKLFFYGNFFCASSSCIRKALLDKAGQYRYALLQLQDYDLWMRLFLCGPVFILQEKLTCYRRFSDVSKHLSRIDEHTKRRSIREYQCIEVTWMDSLSTEVFLGIFGNDMRNPNACTEKEMLCEKAFLLQRRGNFYATLKFAELLEDEECREILSDKYHFELQDFYKMNAE